MKKQLFAAVLAAFLFWAQLPCFAANTATAQTALPVRTGHSKYLEDQVTPYVVAIDTTGEDLTIVTPATGKMACIVGLFMSEGTAANVTIKSGSTTLAVPELAANQGILFGISNHALLCTQPGEALKIQSSAAISNMLIHVIQSEYLDFSGR